MNDIIKMIENGMNINGTIKDGLAILILQSHQKLLAIAEKSECPKTKSLIISEANALERNSRKFRAANIKLEQGRPDFALAILESGSETWEQDQIDCIIGNQEDLI